MPPCYMTCDAAALQIDKLFDYTLQVMADTFTLRIKEIQPSQLYINREKLEAVLETFERDDTQHLEPIPIKELDGELVSTDGHTRLLAWILMGHDEVECEWEDLEMSWEAYRVCVKWCKDEGITSAFHLQDRIIGNKKYQKLWLDRCHEMQKDLGVAED